MGLLAFAASLAGLSLWLWLRPADTPPVDWSVDNNGGSAATRNGGQPAGPDGPKDASGNEHASMTAVRVAVEASATDASQPDQRVCKLRVLISLRDTVGLRTHDLQLANIAVAVHIAGHPGARAIGQSNADGAIEFTFVGGHGQQVFARAATGGQGRAVLTAEQPTELRLSLAPRVVATGRVVDANNGPIAGAEIVLLRWPDGPGRGGRDVGEPDPMLGTLSSIGRSRRDGSFRIPLVAGGRIGARHPDYASSAMFLVRPRRGRATSGTAASGTTASGTTEPVPVQAFELLLHNNHCSVQGIVRDHLGQPVANAEVEIASSNSRPRRAELASLPMRVRSDSSGKFVVQQLPPGAIAWMARATGHGWQHGTGEIGARTANTLAIQLPESASIEGSVVHAATGKAIAFALIEAGRANTLCHRFTFSGADGSFRLTGLGTSRKPDLVRARALDTNRAATAAATAPTTIQEIRTELRVVPGATTVWNVRLGEKSGLPMLTGSVRNARNQPLVGWMVRVQQLPQQPVAYRTGRDGRFAIGVSRANRLDVSVYEPGRPESSFANTRRHNVDVATELHLIVAPKQRVEVLGRVVTDGYAGVPATIDCWHDQLREYARFTADEGGHFRFHVPVGSIDLSFEHPGYVRHKTNTLELRLGLSRDLRTVQLARAGALFGSVLGPDGTPPANLQLSLIGGPQQQRLTADYAAGGYRFKNAAAGQHTLVVHGDGIAGASFAVTIEAGVDLQRNIELQSGAYRRIRILVPDDGGNRVTLVLRASNRNSSSGSSSGGNSTVRWLATADVQRDRPGSEGVALFDTWMLTGSYEVAARTPNNYQQHATIHFPGTGQPEVIMRLTR